MIVGAGIIGLSVARELLAQQPGAKIVILEKEKSIGLHASGRNSGVLHSGIYYQQDSLKARVCLEGARLMMAYCDEAGLPIDRIGKIIVPTKPSDAEGLELLYKRAIHNGARVELINENELRAIEPETQTATGLALYSPDTAVIDSIKILEHLASSLMKNKVQLYLNSACVAIDTKVRTVTTSTGMVITYNHLFNTAGLFADRISQACGLSERYVMLPFKGSYYELADDSKIKINHLIYPVPDMNVPFLGIHLTKSCAGTVYIGPSALPALGRENYQGFQGIKMSELISTLTCMTQQYYADKQGFRAYAHQEIPRFFKSSFLASAQALVPGLKDKDLVASNKVGIRAQLYDQKKKELVMDFLISKTHHETHVLNAVSPAFTSAFSFAKLIVSAQEFVSL